MGRRGAGAAGAAAAPAAAAAAADAGTGAAVVEFGWADQDAAKPVSGRRKKAAKEAKKKNRAGTFDSMGLAPWLLRAIRRKGYRLPTPIQRRAIPLILTGADVIGMARTGSGKTAAFVLPLLQKLEAHASKAGARGLILSPTRELALQTHKVVRELSRDSSLRTAVLVGGDAMEAQFAELAQNPDIIVATPGRLLHHLAEVSGFSLGSIELVVFDEADRMFEMGFAEQVREIVGRLREGRQSLMFSATLPRSLADFAAAGLSAPQLVRLDAERRLSPDLGLAFFTLRADDKPAALLWLLGEGLGPGSPTLVFAATRHHVEFLAALLAQQGLGAAAVYGSMDQTARKINVAKFRAGKVGVLITTDVAARGIDIPLIDNVINYDFPGKPELFVHRCGRAARAGRPGSALSLLTRDELPYLLDLHLYLGRQLAPAPTAPDAEQVAAAAAAMATAGGLVACAAATAAPGAGASGACSLYGAFPGCLLDPLLEATREAVASRAELGGMTRSLANAYALYLKTRPAASSESARRAKALATEGDHPLLLAAAGGGAGGRLNMQHEASLAEFSAKLKAFRPTATVLEAEIAKVRPSHAGPTMQTEAEAARLYRSNEVMSKKRAAHAAIIAKERSKRRLAAAAEAAAAAGHHHQQQQQHGGPAPLSGEQQQPGRKRRRRSGGGSGSEGSGEEGSSNSEAGEQQEPASGSGSEDEAAAGGDGAKRKRPAPDGGGGSGKKRRAHFVLPPVADDAPLADGRFRDSGLFISHTREGRTHGESFEAEGTAAQLASAVLDLTGEDQGAMTAQRRQYRWDKKKKAYVNTAGDEPKRGLKLRKVRNEAGQLVLAGPRKGAQDGSLYKKWAKHNKAAVAATGAPEDAAPDPNLARRFDKSMRHVSFKVNKQRGGSGGGGGSGYHKGGKGKGGSGGGGGPAAHGGELKSKAQVAKERRKKERLQSGMRERQSAHASRQGSGKGGGGKGGGGKGGGGQRHKPHSGGVKGGGVAKRSGGGGKKGGRR